MTRLLFIGMLVCVSIGAWAEDLKLTVPEMEPKLTLSQSMKPAPMSSLTTVKEENNHWTWLKSREHVKPYKFMDDMTFVGVPLFIAGWAIKGDKAMFRVNNKEGKKNTQLLTDFKTCIDDYTQYFGPAMTIGLKLGGVEGRSDWGRLFASAAMSYGIMAAVVNGIKYTAKEMRPDGSQANSWPSGHTATSFVGATLLHKEYGLTRSPWYSIAGYGVATATGVMRVLNNRHWVSDVMSGAGIGIISTELGYALGDLIFKGRGLIRNELQMEWENPSFFSINMGYGVGHNNIDFTGENIQDMEKYIPIMGEEPNSDMITFRSPTVVDAEGAYFFNKYIGIGGRFRVRAMSAKSFGQYADISSVDAAIGWLGMVGNVYLNFNQVAALGLMTGDRPVTEMRGIVNSDHLTEFTASVGMYFNVPITPRFSVGTKLLIGRSFNQDLDIDAFAAGNVTHINYDMKISNGAIATKSDGTPDITLYPPDVSGSWSDTWDYLTIAAKSTTSYGTGLSFTYHYKSNFSWRLFCDYDYTRKRFDMTVDPYHYLRKALSPEAYGLVSNPLTSKNSTLLDPVIYRRKQTMHYFTLGLSFMVNL